MNVSRMKDDDRLIVIAVKDVDELLVWQRHAELRNEEERIIYTRLHAIADIHMMVYVV